MEKILWACALYPDHGQYLKETPARLKALVLLMRYAGLRIGDAVTLGVDRIKEGRLFLYTQKTKVPVWWQSRCSTLPSKMKAPDLLLQQVFD